MTFKPDGQEQPAEHDLLIATSEKLHVAAITIDYLTGQMEALITLNSALLRTHPDAMKFAELMKLAQNKMAENGTDTVVLRGHEKAVYWLLDDDGPLSAWRKEVGLPDGEGGLKRAAG